MMDSRTVAKCSKEIIEVISKYTTQPNMARAIIRQLDIDDYSKIITKKDNQDGGDANGY